MKTASVLRNLLAVTLMVGIVGVAVELLLLEHFEEWQQWLPLAALGVGLVTLAGVVFSRSALLLKAHVLVMTGFLVTGVLGVYLHYSGNVEFELEMVPSMGGLELFKEAMTGATPALAPGAMALLGLIGLVITYRHPLLRPESSAAESSTE
jgi:hypothetical protein